MLSRKPSQSLLEAMDGKAQRENYAYQKGVRGEELTAGVLETLVDAESNEFVLHSVLLTGEMDIDHILVPSRGYSS